MREPSWTDGQASTSTAGYSTVYQIGSTVTAAPLDWTFLDQAGPISSGVWAMVEEWTAALQTKSHFDYLQGEPCFLP